jgi:hypothetical protein
MSIETLFQVNQMPWPAFNTSQARPYYFPRRMIMRMSVKSKEFTAAFECVSHRPPEGGV